MSEESKVIPAPTSISELDRARRSTPREGLPASWIVGEALSEKERNRLECCICKLVAFDVLVFRVCEHLGCRDCWSRLIPEEKKSSDGELLLKCPLCRKVDKFPQEADGRVRRDFADLCVKCPGYSPFEFDAGLSFCPVKLSYFDAIKHLQVCPFETVLCECSEKIMRSALVEHKSSRCAKRMVLCDHCKMSVVANDLETHLLSKCVVCPDTRVWCRVCNIVTEPGQFLKHVTEWPERHAAALVDEVKHPSSEWIGRRVTAKCFRSREYGTVVGTRRTAQCGLPEMVDAHVIWDDGDHIVHPLFPKTALVHALLAPKRPDKIKIDGNIHARAWKFVSSLEAAPEKDLNHLLHALISGTRNGLLSISRISGGGGSDDDDD